MMRRNIERITVTHLRAMPTVRPWYQKLGAWVVSFVSIALMVAGAVLLVAKLHATDAQLDAAFMQGMQAGHQLCPRGL